MKDSPLKEQIKDCDQRLAFLQSMMMERYEERQLDMVIEELSELTKAILKLRRDFNNVTLHNLIEEFVDVQICLTYIELYFKKKYEPHTIYEMSDYVVLNRKEIIIKRLEKKLCIIIK